MPAFRAATTEQAAPAEEEVVTVPVAAPGTAIAVDEEPEARRPAEVGRRSWWGAAFAAPSTARSTRRSRRRTPASAGQPPGTLTLTLPVVRPEVAVPVVELFLRQDT
ncbi:hypothetical protein [Streptomyces sp. OE57]|uniref:hypothetical protein n=1 Tax=Streptomyces lacaronensis TaxID=3379885 RepID=UPI0039B7484B